MRILQIADVHLTELFPREIRASQEAALAGAIRVYREQHCDLLLFLGDTIHDKSLMYVRSLNSLHRLITTNPDVNFAFIIGNHDFAGSPENHGFYTFSREPNVQIFAEPTTLTESAGQRLVFVPYRKGLHDDLAELTGDYLFGHFGVNEACVTPGMSIAHRIRFSDLVAYKRVFLGHYHLPQDYVSAETSISYVGSLVSQNWNDKNQTKRMLLLDTETDSVTAFESAETVRFYELEIVDAAEIKAVLQRRDSLRAAGHRVRVRTDLNIGDDDAAVLRRSQPEVLTDPDHDVTTMSLENLVRLWFESSKSTDTTLLADGLSLLAEAKVRLAEQDSVVDDDD